MDFDLSDEQKLIADNVARLMKDKYAFENRKTYGATAPGFSEDLWRQYAEMGLLGAPFAEEDGGFGGGAVETMLTQEAFGRALALEPYFASVVLAGGALRHGATAEERAELIPEIAGGGSLTGPLAGAHFDAMSFTTAGDTTFASGHPGSDSPAPFQAPNIGIMRTAGDTDEWTNTSLAGRADFHALTSARVDTTVQLYGIDAASGTLLRSQDSGNTWSTGATLEATDLVAYPGKRDTIYAATRTGIAISTDGGRTFTTDTNAPILNQLAIAADGTLYGIGPDGYVWEKRNDWKRGEVLPGTPQAMTVNGKRVILATDRGIFTTEDLGVVWTPLWQPSD